MFSIRMRAEHQRLLDVHVLQQGISRNGLINRLVLRELQEAGLPAPARRLPLRRLRAVARGQSVHRVIVDLFSGGAAELGVLQGFPPDHPWQPPKVSAQIGNAIPPPLAEACLRALTR